MNKRHPIAVIFLSALILGGCASSNQESLKPTPSSSVQETWNDVHRSGARDTVSLLREGMRTRQVYGATDPYHPLRQPEEIIPIWIPAHTDPETGRRIAGHWQHSVVRGARWSD